MSCPRYKSGKTHAQHLREKIKTVKLLEVLQNFAIGETRNGQQVKNMDANRIRAIEILLRKALPDLSAVSMTDGNGNAPFVVNFHPLPQDKIEKP